MYQEYVNSENKKFLSNQRSNRPVGRLLHALARALRCREARPGPAAPPAGVGAAGDNGGGKRPHRRADRKYAVTPKAPNDAGVAA